MDYKINFWRCFMIILIIYMSGVYFVLNNKIEKNNIQVQNTLERYIYRIEDLEDYKDEQENKQSKIDSQAACLKLNGKFSLEQVREINIGRSVYGNIIDFSVCSVGSNRFVWENNTYSLKK